MFSRDKSDAQLDSDLAAPGGRKNGGMPSIISADLKVIGDLHSDGDLQIDGTIEGDVESRSLTIGTNATIKGSVSADVARICGTVEGEVKATSVTVAETARVVGDVVHEKLSVETGAYLEGACRHISAKPAGKANGAKLSVLKADEADNDLDEGIAPIAG